MGMIETLVRSSWLSRHVPSRQGERRATATNSARGSGAGAGADGAALKGNPHPDSLRPAEENLAGAGGLAKPVQPAGCFRFERAGTTGCRETGAGDHPLVHHRPRPSPVRDAGRGGRSRSIMAGDTVRSAGTGGAVLRGGSAAAGTGVDAGGRSNASVGAGRDGWGRSSGFFGLSPPLMLSQAVNAAASAIPPTASRERGSVTPSPPPPSRHAPSIGCAGTGNACRTRGARRPLLWITRICPWLPPRWQSTGWSTPSTRRKGAGARMESKSTFSSTSPPLSAPACAASTRGRRFPPRNSATRSPAGLRPRISKSSEPEGHSWRRGHRASGTPGCLSALCL